MLTLIHARDMSVFSVKNYYDSFSDLNDLNSYAIKLIDKDINKYLRWVYEYEKNMYYLVDNKNLNYIIGYGTFHDSKILNYHKRYLNEGHIGYSVRPEEQNKGYGTILLNLLLQKCEELGMHEVCVSCLKENIKSKRVILNNKGILEKEFYDDESGSYGLKYWIKLNPKISVRIKRMLKH